MKSEKIQFSGALALLVLFGFVFVINYSTNTIDSFELHNPWWLLLIAPGGLLTYLIIINLITWALTEISKK